MSRITCHRLVFCRFIKLWFEFDLLALSACFSLATCSSFARTSTRFRFVDVTEQGLIALQNCR